MLLLVLASIAAGTVAGSLGTLLGLGGGFLLVPFFQMVVGTSFEDATGLSLVAIVANSMVVSTARTGRELVNVRLAVVLQVLTVIGATTGALLIRYDVISEFFSKKVFGVVAVMVAAAMLQRLDKRNVIDGPAVDVGTLGGRFPDHETGRAMSYRVRRLPLAASSSVAAGIISSIAGVGGGMVIVPVLNSWCGVPLRVAAATSAFILGATAIPGVLQKFSFGDPSAPALAAATVIGVLAGAKAAGWLGDRLPVRALKIALAVILAIVAAKYLAGWGE